MSAPFLLSTTWWAHNPQFHRIETWLSCTPCCQRYSSCLTLYVIHGPLACWSILVSDTILIPVAQNPFRTLLQAMNDCLSAWNFLSHCLTLLSMCVICSTREILICSFLGYPQMNFPYNILSLQRCPLPICKYVGVPKEKDADFTMMTWSREMKMSM